MADFRSWSHENLARFCLESQEEIVRLNNRYAKLVSHFKMLLDEYEKQAHECIKVPERNHVYRTCKQVFETQ